ncbi:MAG: elongation factor P maturation arginine rhamnosyltransferase EarP [Burkholderiales bacterium]|jgi:uncharacterized repeat protein (TIGR03837 family)|uniref:elongation factor P maturation arginine rhamnosyltransferase EarP n=1 Tax=Limnobacter sp. TaxID=2003368 RepID=UPI003926D39C|nr:elongation factor P maturation arginine rhamnosyltransferase EarP [Burkholderiales bacterium]
MHIGIVCKVIDNFGDAGFSLRLAKALVAMGHSVDLFHDEPTTFQALYPRHENNKLSLIDATGIDFEIQRLKTPELILEPFGTSSEQTKFRFDSALKRLFPETPWLLIDYLSSESWVESFHLSNSADPSTGHVTTFFYPGFTDKTGGLIHCDYPTHLIGKRAASDATSLNIFVFAYPNAPIRELIDSCNAMNTRGSDLQIGLAGNAAAPEQGDCANAIPFVAQSGFDELLATYDVLFVRGEDSFVRAQLAGKPFIWQIYPTEDNAHAEKLACFFDLYSTGLGADCKLALWNCWLGWNGIGSEPMPDFGKSWIALLPHLPELQTHALKWQSRLLNGRELVKEVLTWRSLQTPTLNEKPDL